MTQPTRYLDTKQAAAYLGISPKTLNKMRVTGTGPRYAKANRRVIYDLRDLDRWVEDRKRDFTGESDDERRGSKDGKRDPDDEEGESEDGECRPDDEECPGEDE